VVRPLYIDDDRRLYRLADGRRLGRRISAIIVFLIQLALNAAWSMLFFGLRAPALALIEISLLWVAILVNVVLFLEDFSSVGRPPDSLLDMGNLRDLSERWNLALE